MTAIDCLKKLVAFNTTSRNSNLDLINYLANTMDEQSIRPILIRDNKQPKANLLASIPGKKQGIEGGIIFSGHTDVVPVDGQSWASNPFEATIRDGAVFGRGTCDMKGFIAVAMSLIPRIKDMHLDFPVHFAFSYDEEIGCLGAPYLIEKIAELEYKPQACIVGEPTSMKPVVGHKGKRSYRCQIHGVAAHSSLVDQACNAIEYASSFISYLNDMGKQYRLHGHRDASYDVPYTTIATNLIKGGNSYNTIPSLCEFIFEFRNLALDDSDSIHKKITAYVEEHLLPEMKFEQTEVSVVLDTIANAPGLDTEPSESLVKLAQSLCDSHEVLKVAYATEAGMFQKAHIPTIVCGPGSIEQAHRANEFVSLEQLDRCERFLTDILRQS